jgi:hypothetical protein
MFRSISSWWRLRQLRQARKYPCCRRARNLTQRESGRPDTLLEVCRCSRRHFVMKADPGALGAVGATPGGQ